MKRNTAILTGMGLSALVVIFAVVALGIFAGLSVSTAAAQQRLGEKTRSATVQYYEADSQAQEMLARLRGGEMPQGVKRQGDIYSYECPIGEDRCLAVAVELREEGYRVLRWQVCATEPWHSREQLPVWKGE